jgi:hypothetical protein
MDKERRKTPRFQFIAPAELVCEKSGERIQSWVADLGLHGCAVTTKESPRRGTVVSMKIGHTPRETVLARAVIVHSAQQRMGIRFVAVTPASLEMLGKWLSKAKFPVRRKKAGDRND